jgi:hypothetical protein
LKTNASAFRPVYLLLTGASIAFGLTQRLKLPVQWNNHFLFGNCGSVTSTSVNPVDNAESFALGYAVVNTDTGHEQEQRARRHSAIARHGHCVMSRLRYSAGACNA